MRGLILMSASAFVVTSLASAPAFAQAQPQQQQSAKKALDPNEVVCEKEEEMTTRYPFSSSNSARYEPSWPVMPVMSAVGMASKIEVSIPAVPRSPGADTTTGSPKAPRSCRASPRCRCHHARAACPRGARFTLPAFRQRVQTFTFSTFPSISVLTTCRFGFQVRRVLLLACETLLPYATPLPQLKQRFR